jgi:hypothetical protein
VTSRKALDLLPKIPGAHLPEEVMTRLTGAADVRAEGLKLAREIAEGLAAIPGVAGVHLMLFGPDHDVLPEVIAGLPATRLAAANGAQSAGHMKQSSAPVKWRRISLPQWIEA